MNTSRIEIYDSTNDKPTVIQPPKGREFTREYKDHGQDAARQLRRMLDFETRALPTPKEQRAEKLAGILADYWHGKSSDRFSLEKIEAIFAEYPLEEK